MAPPAPSAAPVNPLATVFKPAKTVTRKKAPELARSVSPLQAVGFAALLLFLYISSGRITDYVLWQYHIPFVASMAALVVAVINRSLLDGFLTKIGWMFAGFTIWMLLTIPTSTWRGGSIELVKETWSKSLAAFVITAALIFTSKHVVRSIHVLAWGFLTAAILGFPFGVEKDGRFYLSQGGYTGANEYASAMVQGVIAWMFLVQDRSSAIWWRVLGLLPLIPIVIILSRTGSRAAFVSLIVVMIWMFWRQTAQGKVVFLIIAGVGLVGAASIMSSTTRYRLLSFFQPVVNEQMTSEEEDQMTSAVASTQSRLDLLRRSIEFTIRNPVFGVGPGQFAVADDGVARDEGKKRGNWQGTHNTYTQISSEMGIPGLAFYLGIMWFCWTGLRRIRKRVKDLTGPYKERWLLTAFTLQLFLIQFAVFFCFAHIAYDPTFPLLAAIMLGFIRVAEQELPRESKRPAGVSAITPASA